MAETLACGVGVFFIKGRLHTVYAPLSPAYTVVVVQMQHILCLFYKIIVSGKQTDPVLVQHSTYTIFGKFTKYSVKTFKHLLYKNTRSQQLWANLIPYSKGAVH